MDGVFSFRPTRLGAMDSLLPALELYPENVRDAFSISRPADGKDAIWLHPGEPVFERFRALVTERLADEGKRGAVFVDPTTEKPYLFHMALLSVVCRADVEAASRRLEETTRRDVASTEELLDCRRENALSILRREPELIAPGMVTFVVHALVVPSSDPADLEQHEIKVERAAMQIAQAFEEAAGARVLDVHTPELARASGLPDNPGFDLLSLRSANEKRAIEVKGRAGTGDIEVSANEWAKACNLREGYWLYAVYDCATPSPRLARVKDPFGSLLAKAKGSMLINAQQILRAGEA